MRRIILAVQHFLSMKVAGGIILIIVALAALILANSPVQYLYEGFLNYSIPFRFMALDINYPLLLWVNDALMALFFLVVGLEVKRELLIGSLANLNEAIFPVTAALGGMLIPALIYLVFNFNQPDSISGWGIPMATDIAFALGVMTLLGSRVPNNLKVFLLALAIIDDLGAIIVIALFYTQKISMVALLLAILSSLVLIIFNYRGVSKIFPYILVGLVLWIAILKSGIHATLAGVILGFVIPLKVGDERPAEKLEYKLHPWITYGILPLFAFCNAGVSIKGLSVDYLISGLSLGIILGLLIGKPIGISLVSWLAVKSGIANLPNGIEFRHILAVSVLCGIGFTMSIFISFLVFGGADTHLGAYSRLSVIIGSLLSGVLGYFLLRRQLLKSTIKQS